MSVVVAAVAVVEATAEANLMIQEMQNVAEHKNHHQDDKKILQKST